MNFMFYLDYLIELAISQSLQVYHLFVCTITFRHGPCSYLLDPALRTMCSRCPQAHKGIQGHREWKARRPH